MSEGTPPSQVVSRRGEGNEGPTTTTAAVSLEKEEESFNELLEEVHPIRGDYDFWYTAGCQLSGSDCLTMDGKDYDAVECFAEAYRCDPNRPPWNEFGMQLHRERKVTIDGIDYNRKQCYLQALEIDPDNPEVWNNLGCELLQEVALIEAEYSKMYTKIDCFAQAVRCDPSYAPAWRNLGSLIHLGESIDVNGTMCTKEECLARGGEAAHRTRPSYLSKYSTVKDPTNLADLMRHVQMIVKAHAEPRGISEEHQRVFLCWLENDVRKGFSIEDSDALNDVFDYATQLWKSTLPFPDHRGVPFSRMLNDVIRKESSDVITNAIAISRAINRACVDRPRFIAEVPERLQSNCTFRGGTIPRDIDIRNFFDQGRTFAAPTFISTSSNWESTLPYLKQASQDEEPVLWTFYLLHEHTSLPEERYGMLNYILDGEEFLFVPYSVFTVRSVVWESCAAVDVTRFQPHRIEVYVLPNPLTTSRDVPIAPWC